jgi:succinyl-CoA synthetase alpha subunit
VAAERTSCVGWVGNEPKETEGEASVSILVDRDTRLLVQGITGREGSFHTTQMVEYGTNVVAGVTPGGKGKAVAGVPVFDTVADAVAATQPNVSIIYVPARFAPDAIYEAVDGGIPFVVCITEGIPVADMVPVYAYVRSKGARLLGPNCPGLITPGQAKVGIMPGFIHEPGPIGLVSRSGTLTYEVVDALTRAGLGQTTAVGIGGDPVIGTAFVDVLALFEADPATEAIVMIGEIGGSDEEDAARFIQERVRKPVVGFIAGRTAPPGKRMGHAGAIISGGTGTAAEKVAALEAAGARVADRPSAVPELVKAALA